MITKHGRVAYMCYKVHHPLISLFPALLFHPTLMHLFVLLRLLPLPCNFHCWSTRHFCGPTDWPIIDRTNPHTNYRPILKFMLITQICSGRATWGSHWIEGQCVLNPHSYVLNGAQDGMILCTTQHMCKTWPFLLLRPFAKLCRQVDKCLPSLRNS